jgi:hypothetical protein
MQMVSELSEKVDVGFCFTVTGTIKAGPIHPLIVAVIE